MRRIHPTSALVCSLLVFCCNGEGSSGPAGPGPADVAAADVPDAPRQETSFEDSAEDPDVTKPEIPALGAGDATRLLALGDRLELRRASGGAEKTLLVLPAAEFVVLSVPALDDTMAYDPYYLEEGAEMRFLSVQMDGLSEHRGVAFEVAGSGDGTLTLLLELDNGSLCTVEASAEADDRLSLHVSPPEPGDPAVFVRVGARVDATEAFYGLGEVFDRVEHRGMLRPMHFEVSNLESGYNEAHVPVPLLVGTRGWGIFVESYRLGVFDVAATADDEVRFTFGLGADWPSGLRFHLFAADHPLDITRHYYEVTGYPGPIAPWALGPWIWRDEVAGQEAVEADLDTIRELDLATTGYWIDRPYASAVNSFDFEPANYADPEAMISKAHSAGFEMALWHTPYLDPDDPDSAPLHEHAEAMGFFPKVVGATTKWGPPIDYTNPAAVAWFQEQLEAYAAIGIRGYKLDYAEEVIPSAFGVRVPWLFHDGSDELTMHRRSQILYHRMYAQMLPEEGGFLLCRAGAYGDQTAGVIIWPGDIDANMARHGETVTEEDGDTYVAVGGLPAAVVAGSSLGPSGFPYFGSDTGGYRHAPPDKETYIRWFEHTALSTVMQVGTNSNDLPWQFGKNGVLDPEILDLYRAYARLHLRLFPYLFTLAKEIQMTGRAIQRPFGLAYPDRGEHPSDAYLLGDDLLVAPVVLPGVVERTVPLPPGVLVDFWTGERHEGTAAKVPAPIDRIPLLLRAGAPLPLLRDTIDTLSPVAGGSTVDSFATDPNPLHARVAAGPKAQRTLYDGTVLTQSPVEGGLRLERAPGGVFSEGLVVEVFGVKAPPTSVLDLQGQPVPEAAGEAELAGLTTGWLYRPDEHGGLLLVKVPGGATGAEVRYPQ